MKGWLLGLLIAGSRLSASGHADPFVTFACRFVDAHGQPISGLSVSLETGNGSSESEIKAGAAEIRMAFGRDYAGSLKMRIYDRRRERVPVLVPGTGPDSQRVFTYAHRTGQGLLGRADLRDFLNEGTEYPGDDGKVHKTQAAARAFRVDWWPERVPKRQAEEEKAVGKMDRDIDEEIQARLQAIRARRAVR